MNISKFMLFVSVIFIMINVHDVPYLDQCTFFHFKTFHFKAEEKAINSLYKHRRAVTYVL